MTENIKVVATNRKASFEYFLLERFEAGLALQGSEIKSIRAGQISIQESFVDIENGEQAWLVEAHIAPYEQANRFNHEPRRRRRLLLHKKQIRELWNNVRIKGMTIVPTRVYLKNGRAKIEIAHHENGSLESFREIESGLADGIMNNYMACRAIFDVSQGAANRKPWASKRCSNNIPRLVIVLVCTPYMISSL